MYQMDILEHQSLTFLAPETGLWKTIFPWLRDRRWFQNDVGTLYLFCTLFLLYLYQLYLRSSDIGSQRLGTPVLEDMPTDTGDWSKHIFQNVSRTWQWPYTPNFEISCSLSYVFNTWNIVRCIKDLGFEDKVMSKRDLNLSIFTGKLKRK